jgi:CRISPR-associated protein Csh2
MLDAIWNGTKNLISGSKFGQMPRLLIQIIYKKNQNFHIVELDRLVSINSEKPDEAIRDISELKIDITELVRTITKYKDKIEKIRLKSDDRIKYIKDGQDTDLKTALKTALNGLTLKELAF